MPWREEAPSQRVESEGAQPRDGALGLESAQVGDSGEFSVALTGSHLRRWMVWLGSLLVVAAIGAIVMFAIARGEKERFAAGGESADAGAVAPKSTTEPAVEPAPLALSAERVKIDFLSTPNTAAVFEGDKQVCVTPCSISRPKGPNKIRLTLKKKGYRDLPVAVTLDRDRVEELTLRRAGSRGAAPARVKIDFASTPAGADVFAGGTQVCTTPCSIEWRRGRRKTAFTLKKEGYRDQSIVVQPGRNRVEKVTLHAVAPPAITEAKIEISFESDPSQAAVFAGRTQVGTTPCTIGWPRGQKEVTFTLKKDGYQNRPVAVRPDRDRTEKVTLRRPRTPPPMYPESEDSP